jgi:hypothetical protein
MAGVALIVLVVAAVAWHQRRWAGVDGRPSSTWISD